MSGRLTLLMYCCIALPWVASVFRCGAIMKHHDLNLCRMPARLHAPNINQQFVLFDFRARDDI
eukprot:scaffold749_cov242-Chaetoceros_neogracile.AAC.14